MPRGEIFGVVEFWSDGKSEYWNVGMLNLHYQPLMHHFMTPLVYQSTILLFG